MDFMAMPSADVLGVLIAVFSVAIAAASSYYFLSRKPKGCLDPQRFKEFKLIKKTQISPNVARFRFSLPTPKSVLGLPVGTHVVCRGKDSEGQEVTRPYTPITLDSQVGYFELVVKMYPKGRMSHHFREMREGDYLAVKGPQGRFKYKPGQVRAFGMIAGGSGITPMFQLTRAILENPKDKTIVHLIYANSTFEDILLKEDLDDFARKFPDSFKVYYVLSKPPEAWTGGGGRVSKEMIQNHCPPPAPDIRILRCGPPGMNKAVAAHLNALGVKEQFRYHSWITVSQSYVTRELLRNILKRSYEAKNEPFPDRVVTMDEELLFKEIKEYLRQERYLVVFDDNLQLRRGHGNSSAIKHSDTRAAKLPRSIRKLHDLESLDLRNSFVEELPVEIRMTNEFTQRLSRQESEIVRHIPILRYDATCDPNDEGSCGAFG
ncbi:hypothetical protein D5086_021038 [Populus alba]|uniref:Uncharacterized protein n=1 Tax=Populus alba TaxID=43335 RepID=A0ACC4BN74_POPAL